MHLSDRVQSAILAQKSARKERSIRWLVALSTLPTLGVVAAFGIVPQSQHEYVQVRTVAEELPLPSLANLVAPAYEFWREEKIQRGDTVASILVRLSVTDPAAIDFLRTTTEAHSLRQLIPGKSVRAKTTQDGQLLALRYLNNGAELLVERQGESFRVSEEPAFLEQRTLMQSGEIRSSLFAATDAAGLPDAVALQIAEIFASDIDFHRDLRQGDRFTVVYEMGYSDGEPAKVGRVLAAEFVNQGKAYRAVYFQASGKSGAYYAPDGKSLRKAFLRSPLEFSRISSGFTTNRFHPVLKEWRAHRGVDYAAATGTRIRATADGVVAFVGRQGGYGNLVILQHAGKYSTAYGHLSGFTKGLRRGQRVNQGEIIGYVGMTGLATGPHLHYEFRVGGAQIDPLKVALPVAEPITPGRVPAFRAASEPLLTRLDLLRQVNLASLD